MAQDQDFAVIIGVQAYPGLTNLEGPENDARAFRDWVVSPEGGNVPDGRRGQNFQPGWNGNVRMILSSDYPVVNAPNDARPICADVQAAFNDLYDLAEANAKAGQGTVAGRRLYIYMAGHGIEPQLNHTALLMANAKERRFGFHILGKDYADFFYSAGFFAEILLFMDCCRDYFPMVPLTPVPFDTRSDHAAPDHVHYLYGFATKWKRRSRERPINGQTRGVFTTALLEGLRGGASDGNRITAASLRSYLNECMQLFFDPQSLQDPEIPKQPEFVQFPSEGDGLVIVENVPPLRYDVVIHLSPDTMGKRVQVLGPKFTNVAAQTVASADRWPLQLPRGLYLAQALELGQQADFEVKGTGGTVDVQLRAR
ncbi:MAG: caspase family protein [Isosphaeraceae bacterium]|nr:caspase family protein [Isosphaeraceae bacterium]